MSVKSVIDIVLTLIIFECFLLAMKIQVLTKRKQSTYSIPPPSIHYFLYRNICYYYSTVTVTMLQYCSERRQPNSGYMAILQYS